MIDIDALRQFVADRLAGTEYFPVEVKANSSNEIKVEIDSTGIADIDFCVALSKAIEEAFPRDEEDYELEVGTAGFTSPFKVKAQYEKNVGNDVEVLTRDGRKLYGTLLSVSDDGFTLRYTEKVREPGAKRPVAVDREEKFTFDAVKSVKYDFKF